jgi:hypothetical protein
MIEQLNPEDLELIDPPFPPKQLMQNYETIYRKRKDFNRAGNFFYYQEGNNPITRKLIKYPDRINLLGSIQPLFNEYGFLKGELPIEVHELFWNADCHALTCLHHFGNGRKMPLSVSLSEMNKLGLADNTKTNAYIKKASTIIDPKDVKYGDFIFFKDEENKVKHSTIYVGTLNEIDYVLSKNGTDLHMPYSLVTLEFVSNLYKENEGADTLEYRKFIDRDKSEG